MPTRLKGLRGVALRTSAFDESVEFYAGPWGLEIVERTESSAYLRATGDEHDVLELHGSEQNGLDHITCAATVLQISTTVRNGCYKKVPGSSMSRRRLIVLVVVMRFALPTSRIGSSRSVPMSLP